MYEPDNLEMVKSLHDQLDSLVTKLNTVLDISIELSDSPKEIFIYNKLYFEKKKRVINFKHQSSIYISGKKCK